MARPDAMYGQRIGSNYQAQGLKLSRHAKGTGLGLSMSHDIIVKQHGGEIEVNTEPRAFTEFIITLPRSAATQPPARG